MGESRGLLVDLPLLPPAPDLSERQRISAATQSSVFMQTSSRGGEAGIKARGEKGQGPMRRMGHASTARLDRKLERRNRPGWGRGGKEGGKRERGRGKLQSRD